MGWVRARGMRRGGGGCVPSRFPPPRGVGGPPAWDGALVGYSPFGFDVGLIVVVDVVHRVLLLLLLLPSPIYIRVLPFGMVW